MIFLAWRKADYYQEGEAKPAADAAGQANLRFNELQVQYDSCSSLISNCLVEMIEADESIAADIARVLSEGLS